MANETDEVVLRAAVDEWLTGTGEGTSTVELTVVSAGGSRTQVATHAIEPGQYELVRRTDEA